MDIEKIHLQEIQYILSNILNIKYKELSLIKHLFTKRYSVRVIERINQILSKRLYFLLSFFTSDEFEYFDEDTYEIYNIDKMSFYKFTIDNNTYYLLFSVIYDKDSVGIKKESVEIFKQRL